MEHNQATIFVDGLGCAMRAEAERVARRVGCRLVVVHSGVSRSAPSLSGLEEIVSLADGPEARGAWVRQRIRPGDVCVTDTVSLALDCMHAGGAAISTRGYAWSEGRAMSSVAAREVCGRQRGEMAILPHGGPLLREDRQRFLVTLDACLMANEQAPVLAFVRDESGCVRGWQP